MRTHILALTLLLAAIAAGHQWSLERVDTAGSWTQAYVGRSRTGVLHFLYSSSDGLVMHSRFDSVWHREVVGQFPTLARLRGDVGTHGEVGALLVLPGGVAWLCENRDTSWVAESVPANMGDYAHFSYDSTVSPAVFYRIPPVDPYALGYARREGSAWVPETAWVSGDYSERRLYRFIHTSRNEPCVLLRAEDPYFFKHVTLLMRQADTWGEYTVANADRRDEIVPSSCATDTSGGVAVLYNYRLEYTPVGLYYKAFGQTQSQLLDTAAGGSSLAVDSCASPHAAYLTGCLKYVRQTDSGWHYDTVCTSPNLGLAGLVIDRGEPVVGFTDPASGVWLARRVPAGVAEGTERSGRCGFGTIASSVLEVADGGQRTSRRTELLDATGRKVAHLRPGSNDVRHLSPGVYFVVGKGQRDQGIEGSRQKVVITR